MEKYWSKNGSWILNRKISSKTLNFIFDIKLKISAKEAIV